VKNTVPPATFAPLGLVGWVSPGPVVGPADEAGAAPFPLLLLLFEPELDDPHALAKSAMEMTPMDATSARVVFSTLSSRRLGYATTIAWPTTKKPPTQGRRRRAPSTDPVTGR
jgi:hypothetical protein